jgi:GNAT superfamily N-acetyltransferase
MAPNPISGSASEADAESSSGRSESVLTTRSGFSFQVQSADQADKAALAEFFTHVSEDDIRFRFLSSLQKVGHTQLELLTQVDHRRSENFLAFDPATGSLVASAMVVIDEDLASAEVAIIIRADFKNRGIGWCLLEHAAGWAAAMGAKTLQAVESRDNRSAIRVERDMGFSSRPFADDATLTILEKSLISVETQGFEGAAR